MDKIEALFWDNGGVILTNGWDRDARKRAVEKFHLDWADFEDRHELMLNAFETGRVDSRSIPAPHRFLPAERLQVRGL